MSGGVAGEARRPVRLRRFAVFLTLSPENMHRVFLDPALGGDEDPVFKISLIDQQSVKWIAVVI
jgi:hypothetical protein